MQGQWQLWRLALCLGALSTPVWWEPLGQWLAYQPSPVASYLGMLLLFIDMILMGFALITALVVAPGMMLISGYRFNAVISFGAAVLYLVALIGGLILGQRVWHACVTEVTQRGEPLVAAIHRYTEDHGRPPRSLDDLSPHYIESIPSTGIGSSPEFLYESGKPGQWDDNPWVVYVIPPSRPGGFDLLLYFPRDNYPKVGYGGGIERIGNWGYVHE